MWPLNNIPRRSFIFRLALHYRSLNQDGLYSWKVLDSKICVLCNKAKEDVSHLLFSCEYSYKVWVKAMRIAKIMRGPYNWFKEISWFDRKAKGSYCLQR